MERISEKGGKKLLKSESGKKKKNKDYNKI